MGTLIFFPTDRYGSVTRNTEQPHAVERLAAWLRKVAHIRASASMGCEETLEQAPNIIPLSRHYTKDEAMARSIRDYCNMRGYSRTICKDAIRVGIMRIKDGKSVATAIASAKVRADFAHQHAGNGNGPEAA
jgi:hypothetical protein